MTKKKARPKVERTGRRVQHVNDSPSMTQQQFKSAVDPSTIVNRYIQTGIDPYESRKQRMRFADTTQKSFTEAMFYVAEVKSAFETLPAIERQAFQNDPEAWIASLEGQHSDPDPIGAPEASEESSALEPSTTTDRPENDDPNIT